MRIVAILAMVTAAWLGAASTAAAADKGVAVRIETNPDGALVYLGDQDAGALGQTPLELTLPPGEHVVILQAPGRVPLFETIVVEPRKGKAAKQAQVFSFFLPPATGTLVIEGDGLPDDARVVIDGEDAGAPPIEREIDAGAHQVQVLAPGREPYEEWVEVEGGARHEMSIAGTSLVEAGGAVVEGPPPPRTRAPAAAGPTLGTARAGVEVGWRRFAYEDADNAALRPFDASSRVMPYVEVELHPWRRSVRHPVLDRLSLTAMAGLAPAFTATNDSGASVDVFWREQAAGVRGRATPHPRVAIDIDVGWMRTLYVFRGPSSELVPGAPDVDYHLLRLGARGVARAGAAEAWLGVENRLVLSAGPIEDRFDTTDVDGVAARAGAAYRLLAGRLEARVEGAVERLGWTFSDDDTGSFDGSDTYYGVSLTLGASY